MKMVVVNGVRYRPEDAPKKQRATTDDDADSKARTTESAENKARQTSGNGRRRQQGDSV